MGAVLRMAQAFAPASGDPAPGSAQLSGAGLGGRARGAKREARGAVVYTRIPQVALYAGPAEYASAGKAGVASRLPAVQAMLADGREAVLRPAQDLDAWTNVVTRLLADLDAVVRLGALARTAYEARLSWDPRARRIIDARGL